MATAIISVPILAHDVVARFLQERRILLRISSPNVVEGRDLVVEARVGAYGTDAYNWMVGVPQISVPPTFTGAAEAGSRQETGSRCCGSSGLCARRVETALADGS